MPVRSSTSSVLRWPEAAAVRAALESWAEGQAALRPGLIGLGYFGSYARGDAGVGSDLDLVAVVSESDLPFERRGAEWPLEELPLPAEILVYTRREWRQLLERGGRFADTLRTETVWLIESDRGVSPEPGSGADRP